jgi:hypothetical protein
VRQGSIVTLVILTIFLAATLPPASTSAQAAEMLYNPVIQSLSVEPGAITSFVQGVTSPSGSSFSVSLTVVGAGANPIPASWVSVSPTSLIFLGIMTKFWNVTIAPPPGTPDGVYTAAIKAKPSDGSFGEGSGTAVTLRVGALVPTKAKSWGSLKVHYR